MCICTVSCCIADAKRDHKAQDDNIEGQVVELNIVLKRLKMEWGVMIILTKIRQQ